MAKLRDWRQMRREYVFGGLRRADLLDDPVALLDRWLGQAQQAGLDNCNAMALSTVDAQGAPHSRIVLLKAVDARGLQFFSNFDSDKGRELAQEPRAALLFFWSQFDRQIRVEGRVEHVSREESVAYFQSRPVGSQAAAAVSAQSRVVESREDLEAPMQALLEHAGEGPIDCPAHWGGYRLLPERFEFWQGRENRLHDRFVYQRSGEPDRGEQWVVQRLAP